MLLYKFFLSAQKQDDYASVKVNVGLLAILNRSFGGKKLLDKKETKYNIKHSSLL